LFFLLLVTSLRITIIFSSFQGLWRWSFVGCKKKKLDFLSLSLDQNLKFCKFDSKKIQTKFSQSSFEKNIFFLRKQTSSRPSAKFWFFLPWQKIRTEKQSHFLYFLPFFQIQNFNKSYFKIFDSPRRIFSNFNFRPCVFLFLFPIGCSNPILSMRACFLVCFQFQIPSEKTHFIFRSTQK